MKFVEKWNYFHFFYTLEKSIYLGLNALKDKEYLGDFGKVQLVISPTTTTVIRSRTPENKENYKDDNNNP